MSRIGKMPIPVPAGVEVKIDGNKVSIKGPKGTLEQEFDPSMDIKLEDGVITVSRPDDTRTSKSLHGLTRALINNMVIGVSEGFEKRLELAGVGYRAALKGSDLEMQLGYSHPVLVKPRPGIKFVVPDQTHITIQGIDKQVVGQTAAEVRAWRPPEPYKGKGIHYEGEHIRRKLGKAAAAK